MAAKDGNGLPGEKEENRTDREVQVGGLRVYENVYARGEPEDDGSIVSELEKIAINGDVDRSECSCGALADSVNGRLTRICRCIRGTGTVTFKYVHGSTCFKQLIPTHSALL